MTPSNDDRPIHWVAVVLAVLLALGAAVLLLTLGLILLYVGAPPWLVALGIAGLGWIAYLTVQRLRRHSRT